MHRMIFVLLLAGCSLLPHQMRMENPLPGGFSLATAPDACAGMALLTHQSGLQLILSGAYPPGAPCGSLVIAKAELILPEGIYVESISPEEKQRYDVVIAQMRGSSSHGQNMVSVNLRELTRALGYTLPATTVLSGGQRIVHHTTRRAKAATLTAERTP